MNKHTNRINELQEVVKFRTNFYQFCQNLIDNSNQVIVSDAIEEIGKPQGMFVVREVYTNDFIGITVKLHWTTDFEPNYMLWINIQEPDEEERSWLVDCDGMEEEIRMNFRVVLDSLKDLGQEELLTDIDF